MPKFNNYPSLKPRRAFDSVPLTPIQAIGLAWYKDLKIEPARYCVIASSIRGRLEPKTLGRCVSELLRRHESLRTRIVVDENGPRQLIDAPTTTCFSHINFSKTRLPEASVNEAIRKFISEPIDLAASPLFAARLFTLSDEEHVLILTLDHIITDGVSNEILTRELWSLYDACLRGEPFIDPSCAIQLADYAIWLQALFPKWLRDHGSYWKDNLSNAPRVDLATNRHTTPALLPTSTGLVVPFGQSLTAEIVRFSRNVHVFPSLVMFAVYVAMIFHWRDQRDQVIVLIDSGRNRPELQHMIGWLTNHLYVRIVLTRGTTFRELLDLVVRQYRAAVTHRDFNWIPTLLPGLKTDLYFNWQNASHWISKQGGSIGARDDLRVTPLEIYSDSRTALPFGLALFFVPTTTELSATVLYRSDLLAASEVEALVEAFRPLSELLVRQPDLDLDAVSKTLLHR